MRDRINLCDQSNDHNRLEVKAELSGNRLAIIGVFTHLDEAVLKETGSSEYYYFLDEDNTNRFFQKIQSKGHDLKAIKEKFNGLEATRRFREFCTANKIQYAFYSVA